MSGPTDIIGTVPFDVRFGPDDGSLRWSQRGKLDYAERRLTCLSSRSRVRCSAARTSLVVSLACVAVLAVPTLANAQTTVWSATLTPRNMVSNLGCSSLSFIDYWCSRSTNLSDDEFTHGGVTYAIALISLRASGNLYLELDKPIEAASQNLTLHVDSASFPFEDANTKGAYHRNWFSTGLSWTAGTDVSLRLTAPSTPGPRPTGPPTPPRSLKATAGDRQVVLTWRTPRDDGGVRIVRYEHRQREGDGAFGDWQIIWDRQGEESHVRTRRHRVTGLTNGETYTFELRAVNNGGWASPPSEPATATPEKPDPVPALPLVSQLLLALLLVTGGMVRRRQPSGAPDASV